MTTRAKAWRIALLTALVFLNLLYGSAMLMAWLEGHNGRMPDRLRARLGMEGLADVMDHAWKSRDAEEEPAVQVTRLFKEVREKGWMSERDLKAGGDKIVLVPLAGGMGYVLAWRNHSERFDAILASLGALKTREAVRAFLVAHSPLGRVRVRGFEYNGLDDKDLRPEQADVMGPLLYWYEYPAGP